MAGNHRFTVIIDKIYKAFFHCNNCLHWAFRSDQVLHSTFILAPEVEFELVLHQHGEGYDTDNICDLPPMLKRTACIHAVTSTNEDSIDPSGSKGVAESIPPSTPTGRTTGPPFYRSAQKCLKFDDIPPTIKECDNKGEEEEHFPTAPLDNVM